jgi:hypothetical protein
MPKTTYDKDVWRAVSINERFLRAVYAFVDAEEKPPKKPPLFSVYLSDGARIENLTIDELVALPNSATRAFTRIDFETDFIAQPRLRLRIDNSSSSTVTYSVSGNDKDASYISGEIDKLLKDCYQPFSYFFKMPPYHQGVWSGVLGAGVVGLPFVGLVKDLPLASLAGFLIFLAASFFGRIAPWMMPPVTFEVSIPRQSRGL